jgi:hypothetical protein
MLFSKGVDIDTTKHIGCLNPRLSISFEKGMLNPSSYKSYTNCHIGVASISRATWDEQGGGNASQNKGAHVPRLGELVSKTDCDRFDSYCSCHYIR